MGSTITNRIATWIAIDQPGSTAAASGRGAGQPAASSSSGSPNDHARKIIGAARSDESRDEYVAKVREAVEPFTPEVAESVCGMRAAAIVDLADALFTAVSTICVTGLSTVDTPNYWTPFGQVVILVLIQIGGFGVMTLATLIALTVLGIMIVLL